MILSNFSIARARFFSPIESLEPVALQGAEIQENMTLKLRDIKSLLGYFSLVHTKEPIILDEIFLRDLTTCVPDESMSYNEFIETTKLDDNATFYFQATTFVNKVPLIFSDRGLLGSKNTYKPFDSSESKEVDSMLTASIEYIREFSDKKFKFKNYRGMVAFERTTVHKKNYTIYLEDKGFYLTIISSRHTDKGQNTYIGILYTGD